MSDASPVTWSRVDGDFFVASTVDAFLGTVDHEADGKFVARDMRSVVLGAHSTLRAAMAAVADSRGGGGSRI